MQQIMDACSQAKAARHRLKCRGGLTAYGRKRAKVFGEGRAIPLDGNAKARIWAYAQGYTARHRQRGQHRGPLTRAYLDVLKALLWGFHNQHTGRCYPSYESIAEAAKVHRDTVNLAINALELAGVLTWEIRLIRQRVQVMGLLGRQWDVVPRRTSNAYRFRDPQPPSLPILPKSENPTGTKNQVLLSSYRPVTETDKRLDEALQRLSRGVQEAEQRRKDAESP